MTAIYALYTDPDAAQQAVDVLRAEGVSEQDIVVMSSEPFEEHEFGRRGRATWLPWIAVVGGALGFVSGYFLTSVTQQRWPLRTSGMPIVSAWPNAIIIFELTMLGAILATAVALFVTAGLPRRLSHLYDPAVSDGYILVGVETADEPLASRLALAFEAGGGHVKMR